MIKTLAKAQNLVSEKTTLNFLNPKSVTRNELYGYIHQTTREWKDGLISQIFRDLANCFTVKHEYIVLDGDIDAEWIESMNTVSSLAQVDCNKKKLPWFALYEKFFLHFDVKSKMTFTAFGVKCTLFLQVMDDNKTLTLASNERIPLTPPMRLLLEIENMREASPATVSRGANRLNRLFVHFVLVVPDLIASTGGVIFMNSTDVGWLPYIKSWVQKRDIEGEKSQLTKLFDEYAEKSIEWISRNAKTICPIPKISQAMSICSILEGILGNGEAFAIQQKQLGVDEGSKLLEMYFIYAIMWGTGGALAIDKGNDFKDSFSRWFKTEFVKIPFPEVQEGGSIFEYTVDPEKVLWQSWNEKLPVYTPQPGAVFGNIYVVTMETMRLTAILDLVVPYRRPVCFVGGAGTGKTTIMKDKLRSIDTDAFLTMGINFNSFTNSLIAQTAMESVLEKKTGRVFGPPGSKRMIYFIDDLNMPVVDKYGTQQPIALLRQGFDYAAWYDRTKLTLKEVHNLQFLSCMNPTAGSFFVDPRLQRSYMTFAVSMPKVEVLKNIYGSIVKGHFGAGFSAEVAKLAEVVVNATIELHGQVVKIFLPTAVKFHYNFNLRETSNIFQGICRSRPTNFGNAVSIARLWNHECERVFLDRMTELEDIDRFTVMLNDTNKKYFGDLNQEKLNVKPNLFTTFTTPGVDDTDRPYCNISEMSKLTSIVEDRLKEYNESNPVMNLVMFDQAVEHVCRITRVIDQPRGNALLVGVGGSGKQSLAKLSSYIVGYESYQITVTATYGMTGLTYADTLHTY